MSEPVQQGTGESLGAKDFRPCLEGQVRGQHEAVMLIGPADHLKEQFRTGFGEGNISQFIQDQQMDPLELFEQALKPLFFPALHQLSDQIGRCIEANASALGTSGKGQGTDQMSFARSRVSDQQDVFLLVQILSPQKLSHQGPNAKNIQKI